MLKLDKSLVRRFESDQKRFGTEAALYNVFWEIAADIFKAAGVTGIKTRLKHLRA